MRNCFKVYSSSIESCRSSVEKIKEERTKCISTLSLLPFFANEGRNFQLALADGKMLAQFFDLTSQMALCEAKTRTDVREFLKLAKKEVAGLDEEIAFYAFLRDSFDALGPKNYIKYVPIFMQSLCALVENKSLTLKEAAKIIGATMCFNNNHVQDNVSGIEFYVNETIAAFFNPDGSYKYQELVGAYQMALNLATHDVRNQRVWVGEHLAKYTISDFVADLVLDYKKYLAEYKKPKEERVTSKESKEVNLPNSNDITFQPISRIDYQSFEELKKYYKNGDVIAIPDDLEYFQNLLVKCGKSDAEIRYIMEQIKEKQKDSDPYSYLSKEEKEVFYASQSILESLPNYHEQYYEMIRLLKDITDLKDILASTTDSEEIAYYMEVKTDAINSLASILVDLRKDDAKTTNNLVFLTDSNNNSYFASDFASLDNSVKKNALATLGKINANNSSNFKTVKMGKGHNGEIFYLYNGKTNIIFRTLKSGIYLVIGLCSTDESFKKVASRILKKEAEEYLNSVSKMLDDENLRDKLLREQELLIPDLEAAKLDRKKN